MLKYIATLFALLTPLSMAHAHCQIPCGIYDDSMVFTQLEQHITTIEKSMQEISATDNMHDVTRWTVNKEEHAQKIQDIMAQYFLAQRLKPDVTNYLPQLMRIHQITIDAMKAKQTTDLKYVESLRMLVDSYDKLYYAPHEHKDAPKDKPKDKE